MGSRAVRITREEFLTPPEFRNVLPTQNPAGRVGGARVELIRSGESTHMGTCYQQIPIRLFPPLELDGEPAALLYLINLTAGLLDGDAHLVEVTARAGTRAVVTGQSATRIHPALASFSTQQFAVAVEVDACLVVLPGPAIPYRDSRYYQHVRVELAPGARLIWGDIWLPGRYERGALSERFEFERIIQNFEVHRAGRMVYRDSFRWDGPWSAEDVDWYFGGQLASASLFIAGPVPNALREPCAELRRSMFRLDSGDHCIRWCGHPTAVTADLVQTALHLAAQWTGGPDAPPWLIASSSLSPNHWFSTLRDSGISANSRWAGVKT